MKNLFKKTMSGRRKERGIALLFTLGILGLLTVLALSFAASAMLERKAAQYSSGASSARILAQSGLNRAIAAMTYYMTLSDNYDVVVSKDNYSAITANQGTYDFMYRLNTDIDGVYFKIRPSEYDATNTACPHWIYVDNGGTTAGLSPTNELIGRFAYVVMAAGGRLDPSACVDTGIDESSLNASGITSGEPRVGANVYEIYLGGVEPDLNNYLSSGNVQKMNYVNGGGLLTNGGRWTDYSTFFTDAGLASTGTDIEKRAKWQWDWFAVGSEALKFQEAFWIDLDGDDKRKSDGTELFQRFNLKRADWDTGLGGGANSAAAVEKLRGTVPASTRTVFSTTPGTGTDTLEWLKQSDSYPLTTYTDSITAGTFASVAARANQIAANIIDYCDTDSIPTSDVAAASWTGATAPTYTGNEKTPYINDFLINTVSTITIVAVAADAIPDAVTANDYTVDCSVDITALAEAIDIYGLSTLPAVAAATRVQPYSGGAATGITVAIDIDGAPASSSTLDLTSGMNSDMTYSGNYATVSNAFGTVSYSTTILNPGACPAVTITITIPAFNLVLTYDGNITDYSKLPAHSSPIRYNDATNTNALSVTGASTKTSNIRWATDDPRQNLNSSDWVLEDGGAVIIPTSPIGVQNTLSMPASAAAATTAGQDYEASLLGMSTAYIRNAPMVSPWELGTIHRGALWETINLKKYNTATASPYPNLVMGAYSDGDANILDHIKMTSENETYGLVNLKTSNQEVLRALFMGIPVSADYNGILSDTSNPITASNAGTIAGNVKTYISSHSVKNRGEIVNASGMSDAAVMTNQTSDAIKEAIIGKMANLTLIDKSTIFKVVIVAQSIKDAGGPYGTDAPLRKDFNADGDSVDSISSSDTAALLKLGYRDPTSLTNYTVPTIGEPTNCRKGRYEAGFDEINGEQKIIVTIKYDTTTSKWTILNYELVSE
ncbi:MAG: hypothetical protein A2020_03260 [Lentisphaerae bacterium GWF2_45_14]|nr:MAG: hypothetical protein A2020_03260 [Lentisphaerae bacterium GWF2_45_14]